MTPHILVAQYCFSYYSKFKMPKAKSTEAEEKALPLPKPGDLVEWPIRAQGTDRMGRGPVVAVAPAGGRPCDFWPKDRPKPPTREFAGFSSNREHGFAIIEFETPTGAKKYYTPRLTAPVTVIEQHDFDPKTAICKKCRMTKVAFMERGKPCKRPTIPKQQPVPRRISKNNRALDALPGTFNSGPKF
jgi:hypothetical protein